MPRKQSLISGKPQLNRRINASLVFSLIQEEGPLSRPDLATRTGVRLTSISDIVDHLLKEGVIREIGEGKSTGGRRPVLLDINPGGRFAIGLEVAEDTLNGVIVDLAGRVAVSQSSTLSSSRPATVQSRAQRLIDSMVKKSKARKKQLAGIGVAVPGIISKDERRVVLSTALGWEDVDFVDGLQKATNYNVRLVNNAMAGALGAYFDQPRPRVRSLLYVLAYLTHGKQTELASLGCGIVLDGRAYFGEGSLAGEIRVDLEHPIQTARKRMGKKAPARIDDFVEAMRKDPARFTSVWEDFAVNLGEITSRGIDFLSPGLVVIGSDIPDLDAVIGEEVRGVTRRRTIAGLLANHGSNRDAVPIQFSAIEPDTIARGAIISYLQEFSLAPLLRDSVLS